LDEKTGSSEQELTLVEEDLARLTVSDVHSPDTTILDPFTPVHIDTKGHPPDQIILVGHLLQILPQLLSKRKRPTPIRV
jgi:hypothetical protein